MAKKEKNTPQRTTPVGFKTKGGNRGNAGGKTVTAPVVNNGALAKPSKKRVVLISVVAAILLISIALGIFFGFFYKSRFDYVNTDLSKYIKLSESDYKNIKVNIPLYEYSDDLIDRAITDLLVEHKAEKALYNGTGVKNIAITIGDVVTLRFRGYTKDENGKETDISALLNLAADNDATIEVGAYENLVGINEALIGVIPDDVTTFEKITSGVVGADDVVYVSYSGTLPEEAPKTVNNERIDLTRTDLDEVYGTGFKASLVGQEIGKGQSMVTLTMPDGSGTAMYVDLKVEFATRCESEPLKVEAIYPADYEEIKELRGKTVYFDFYIKNCIIYDTPEYNEEFITETLGLSADSLSEYQGETLIEKHRASLKEGLIADIEASNDQLIIEAIWEHLADKGEVIKYPESEVEGYYSAFLADANAYYQANADKYESVDAAVIAVYGLESGDDWQAYLKVLAELEVRDKLIFYYIFNNEGFKPTDEEYRKTYDEIVEHEMSAIIEEHKDELEGLPEDEYNAQVDLLKQEMLDYFGKDGMRELVYYEVGNKKMVDNLVIIE